MNKDPLGAIVFVGSLVVAGVATLVARYTYSTAGFLPLTLGGSALITWRIVAGWTSGLCGDRIRRDVQTESTLAYSAMLVACIGGLALFFGIYQQVETSQGTTAILNDLGVFVIAAFLFTADVVVALYSSCLMYYSLTHRIPPAQPL